MASQDVRPSPFAKMRANLSLRKSFLIFLAVAVLTACALSFATLLGLSRVLQGIYDQSYGGANNFIYLYDKANGTLVPCESINISLSEEEYVPVSRPIPSQRENAVPIPTFAASKAPSPSTGPTRYWAMSPMRLRLRCSQTMAAPGRLSRL